MLHRNGRSPRVSRRGFLAAGAGAAVGSAGCLGGAGGVAAPDGGPVAVASFFTFYDFARRVAEETPIRVENLVPTGLHGHGWDPDPSITRRIVDADAFVNVGPGFQPWADRALRTARDDGAGTVSIDVREGIDLLDLADTVGDEEATEGGKDPHFWLDPELAKQSVDNVAEGLAELAPDHRDALEDNAERVASELDDVDAEWAALFESAERDVVFLAAHNAFEYVGRRYGATIQPLVTNLAAEGDVRPADVQRAQDTIAEHDIRYIGAAVFEPRRPARQLREATGVEAYYPVTPYAGITAQWADRGWGYVDIARNINMPTFEAVLDAREPDADFDAEWRNFE
ncbi:ABC-type transport system periplasmic substrate-binding protein (probable substrate zinc) [Natronomonas moolapensis 8.8.11]|uniref:ABC-type transport system periplasmic substrate-binding protein (Probable substrate zinc) n=1 Tax=Natronomonas moolapensis (strain DSM 18674 / CECT 7526 / JCM 14361 / 8.8.11) TaxID=268739 RepID=M1XT46_NATM8|nr:metal ABC transporter substrate-binding protein [Natronomonas moolapensis]CCQ37585.1 ABC-type transport system periplasmic substrate-binding protein (probable substrate zinc) [Natronomonas moolapensis 8.8.11]